MTPQQFQQWMYPQMPGGFLNLNIGNPYMMSPMPNVGMMSNAGPSPSEAALAQMGLWCNNNNNLVALAATMDHNNQDIVVEAKWDSPIPMNKGGAQAIKKHRNGCVS